MERSHNNIGLAFLLYNLLLLQLKKENVSVRACIYVCVCVLKREKLREKERVCVRRNEERKKKWVRERERGGKIEVTTL